MGCEKGKRVCKWTVAEWFEQPSSDTSLIIEKRVGQNHTNCKLPHGLVQNVSNFSKFYQIATVDDQPRWIISVIYTIMNNYVWLTYP